MSEKGSREFFNMIKKEKNDRNLLSSEIFLYYIPRLEGENINQLTRKVLMWPDRETFAETRLAEELKEFDS